MEAGPSRCFLAVAADTSGVPSVAPCRRGCQVSSRPGGPAGRATILPVRGRAPGKCWNVMV